VSPNFCDFVPAGGASKITSYLRSLKDLVVYDGVLAIGLYDNDQAGKAGFGKFYQHHNFTDSDFKIVKKDRVYCGVLPLSDELQEMGKSLGADVPLPIEFMFPSEVIKAAVDDGVLVLEDRTAQARESEFSFIVNVTEHLGQNLPESHKYLTRKINDATKTSFAAWVKNVDNESWKAFGALFETLERICTPS